MGNNNFHPYGPRARVLDLGRGFNDLGLSDIGELELDPNFIHPIFLALGRNTLKISRISISEQQPSSTMYAIQNTESPKDGIVTICKSLTDLPPDNALSEFDHFRDIQSGRSLIIGRNGDATPTLKLNTTASRKHARVRIGTLQQYFHIMDLGSTNGTFVALNPEDAGRILEPRRTFVIPNDKLMSETLAGHKGRWLRPS